MEFGTTQELKVRTYVMKEFNVLQPTVRCAEPGDIISPVFLYEPMYVLQNMPHPDPYDSHREGCVKAISLATGRLMEYHTRNYVILLDDDILRKKFKRMFDEYQHRYRREMYKRIESKYMERIHELRPDKITEEESNNDC